MKAFKAFIKPFEALQRSVKIKMYVNFFSSSGIGAGRVKKVVTSSQQQMQNEESISIIAGAQTQLVCTSSKSAIETFKLYMKHVQSLQ